MKFGLLGKRGDLVDRLIFRCCLAGVRGCGGSPVASLCSATTWVVSPCIISANACGGTEPTVMVRARPAVIAALTCLLFIVPPDWLNGPNSMGPDCKLG